MRGRAEWDDDWTSVWGPVVRANKTLTGRRAWKKGGVLTVFDKMSRKLRVSFYTFFHIVLDEQINGEKMSFFFRGDVLTYN